mgnify:CR=1 FL=1
MTNESVLGQAITEVTESFRSPLIWFDTEVSSAPVICYNLLSCITLFFFVHERPKVYILCPHPLRADREVLIY